MPDTMPRLIKPEMARLMEIGRADVLPSGRKPATTERLRVKGLITVTVNTLGVPEQVIPHALSLTDLGRAVLAGLPEEINP